MPGLVEQYDEDLFAAAVQLAGAALAQSERGDQLMGDWMRDTVILAYHALTEAESHIRELAIQTQAARRK